MTARKIQVIIPIHKFLNHNTVLNSVIMIENIIESNCDANKSDTLRENVHYEKFILLSFYV